MPVVTIGHAVDRRGASGLAICFWCGCFYTVICCTCCEVACVFLFVTTKCRLKRILPLSDGCHFDIGTLVLCSREGAANVGVREARAECMIAKVAGFCSVSQCVYWI